MAQQTSSREFLALTGAALATASLGAYNSTLNPSLTMRGPTVLRTWSNAGAMVPFSTVGVPALSALCTSSPGWNRTPPDLKFRVNVIDSGRCVV